MVSHAAALAGLWLIASPSATHPAYRIADCNAAVRDEPTLDKSRLPDAAFSTHLEPIGSDTQGPLYLTIGVETASLPSGTGLRVLLEGCENYSNSYEFDIDDRTPLKDGRHWFRRAAELMEQAEVASKDTSVEFAELRRELIQQAEQNAAYDFASGEFIKEAEFPEHGYSVKVERTKRGVTVTVGYWQPL